MVSAALALVLPVTSPGGGALVAAAALPQAADESSSPLPALPAAAIEASTGPLRRLPGLDYSEDYRRSRFEAAPSLEPSGAGVPQQLDRLFDGSGGPAPAGEVLAAETLLAHKARDDPGKAEAPKPEPQPSENPAEPPPSPPASQPDPEKPETSAATPPPLATLQPPPQIPAPPAFAPRRLGEGVYDLLCWGFANGEHKQVLELSRREVGQAARDFARQAPGSLGSWLKQIFVEVEKGERGPLEGRLRLDAGWPGDWGKIGAATARFLHSIDETEKIMAAALSQEASVLYQAVGLDLELKLLEAALAAKTGAPGFAEGLEARKIAVTERRGALAEAFTRIFGREPDLTALTAKADADYLEALAKAAGEGFLRDERTKAWLDDRARAALALINSQIKRKAALEALKMAVLAERDLGAQDKNAAIETFMRLTREGLEAGTAVETASPDADLRRAVAQSQEELPGVSEAASRLELARSLRRLALTGLAPELRLGLEQGLKEGSAAPAPQAGLRLNWAVGSALRLLWSDEDARAPKVDELIAKTGVLSAERDRLYNLERAQAARSRYEAKAAAAGSHADAEDIALLGRALHVQSYSASASAPAAETAESEPRELSSLEDILALAAQSPPAVASADLEALKAGLEVKQAGHRFGVEAGFGAGVVVLDSVLPSLVVTLENLGRQKAAALVRSLGASLRKAKAVFETTYALLQYSNDYLYALRQDEAAEAACRAALGRDQAAAWSAQEARIAAQYRLSLAKSELSRLLGGQTALPARAMLEEMFSLEKDQFYWGNPLFRGFNMDAAISEAGLRAHESLLETQKALAKIPELRLHMTSLLAMLLAPAMPWMPVLAAIDLARTGLPVLSRLLSEGPGEKTKDGRKPVADVYARLLEQKSAAETFAREYARLRDELKAMGSVASKAPESDEEKHLLNRWRVTALAYEIAPGAEELLSDRITAAVEKGDLEAAAGLWRSTHAGLKLESNGRASAAGSLLRGRLNADERFKKRLAKKILRSSDWLETKLLLDSWLTDFGLDFDLKLGGKIVRNIVKGYASVFEKPAEKDPKLAAPEIMEKLVKAVREGNLEEAYRLYRQNLVGGGGPPPAPPASAEGRPLARAVLGLAEAGEAAKAEALIENARRLYGQSGLDFDKYYPGLSQRAAAARPAQTTLRLVPDWDLARLWSGVMIFETRVDRERGVSENRTISAESFNRALRERQAYSFSGPLGPLGESTFLAAGSMDYTRGQPWNPLRPLDGARRGEYSTSLGLTQRSLLGAYDLSERVTHWIMADGSRRAQYGLGTSGSWRGSHNFADFDLIQDSGPSRSRRPGTHFRTYGLMGYGAETDRLSLAARWQADDLYGRRPGSASGEYNAAARGRLPLFKDPAQPELFGSATYFRNRSYLTTGRYYDDRYRKEFSRFLSHDGWNSPDRDGQASYAGLRQMLADGRYGGIGMGYAVQTQTGQDLGQYRTASYVAPAGRGQVDLINSDDPTVGPLALQTQLNAGPAVLRAGLDASSYTFALGGRSSEGELSATGRLVLPARGPREPGIGAALGTPDSSYQALWTDNARQMWLTLRQGDWWQADGLQMDYIRSRYEQRYRLRVALGAMADTSDWTRWVPFAPLLRGIGRSISRALSASEPSREQVVEEIDSSPSKKELAQRAASVLESVQSRLGRVESANRAASSVFDDVVSRFNEDLSSFRRQSQTPIPYSWKPAFEEFLASLSELIPQLRQAQEEALYESSSEEKPSAMWTIKVSDMLDAVLQRYERYRAAYREQIWAIPVSGGIDRRPEHVAAFEKRSQWFVDYVSFIKTEFLEFDRIGKMSDEAVREQLTRLYRLKEETSPDAKAVASPKALRFLGDSEWLPTTPEVPLRSLETRINRLVAERQRRALLGERASRLKARAVSAGKKVEAQAQK